MRTHVTSAVWLEIHWRWNAQDSLVVQLHPQHAVQEDLDHLALHPLRRIDQPRNAIPA